MDYFGNDLLYYYLDQRSEIFKQYDSPEEKCELGFIKWENNNCWLDTIFLALFGLKNEDIDKNLDNFLQNTTSIQTGQDTFMDLSPFKTELKKARGKLLSGENGAYLQKFKEELSKINPITPSGDDFCSSDAVIGWMLQRLFLLKPRKIENTKTVVYTMKDSAIFFYNSTSGMSVRDYNQILVTRPGYDMIYSFILLIKGHYVMYFRCQGGKWFYYDDTKTDYKFIGSNPYSEIWLKAKDAVSIIYFSCFDPRKNGVATQGMIIKK